MDDSASPPQIDSQLYAEHAKYVPDLGAVVVDLLDPQPGERILDLGCGPGVLTQMLQERGCSVVGVDNSPEMVAMARKRGVTAYVIDGHTIPFTDEFDAVFTNAALHWMKNPDRVIDSVWKALKPIGRFVGEFGGKDNLKTIVAAIETALKRHGVSNIDELNPWYFPTDDAYRHLLLKKGFGVEFIELIQRPTALQGDLIEWLHLFANSFGTAIAPADRDAFWEEIQQIAAPALCDSNGHWTADYIRLRFRANKSVA